MTSVVSLRTFATSSSVPIVICVDLQEHLAKPRLLANSEIDRALDNWLGVQDHPRRVVAALYGDEYETADWIASALPCKLGNGKYAGG